MKIIKLIISEENLLGNGSTDAYRRQKDIYNMEGDLLYSFDPLDDSISDNIKHIFNN